MIMAAVDYYEVRWADCDPDTGRRKMRYMPFYLPNLDAVYRRLAELDIQALRVRPKRIRFWQQQWITPWYKEAFLRCLGFIATDEAPVEALMKVLDLEDRPAYRVRFEPARAHIEAGGNFVSAIERLGIFDETVRGLLDAAERVNKIREGIEDAIAMTAKRRATYMKNMAVFGVLGLEMIGAWSSVVYTQFFMIPQFIGIDMGISDPVKKAAMAQAVADAGFYNWILMIVPFVMLLIVGALVSFQSWGSERMKRWAGRVLGRIPLVRLYLEDMAMFLTAQLVGRMLETGMPADQGFKIAAGSTRVERIRAYWEQAVRRCAAAQDIQHALIDDKVLTAAECLQIRSSRDSYQVHQVVKAIGQARERAADAKSRWLNWVGIGLFMLYLSVSVLAIVKVVHVELSSVDAGMDDAGRL